MLEVERRKLKDAVMPLIMRNIPVCIQGQTGVGKTQGLREELFPELCRELGVDGIYHDNRVSGLLAEDFTGIPYTFDHKDAGKVTGWARPAVNPIEDGRFHFISFEEITHNRAVFAPLYRIFSEREDAAGNKLPKLHRLVATCNTKDDKGGDAQLFKPLERRLAWILVKSTNIDTVAYGEEHKWDPRLLTFLKKYPELNWKMPDNDEPAWPNPARWEQVSKFMDGTIKEIEQNATAIIGRGAAMKFAAELEAMNVGIPRMVDVVKAPTTASIPEDDQHQFVIARMLARIINPGNADPIVVYLSRLTPDIASRAAHEMITNPGIADAAKQKVQKLIL